MSQLTEDWLRDRNAQADESDDDLEELNSLPPAGGFVLLSGDDTATPLESDLFIVATSRSGRVALDCLLGTSSRGSPVLSVRLDRGKNSKEVTHVYRPASLGGRVLVADVSERAIGDSILARWSRLLLDGAIVPTACLVLDSLPTSALVNRPADELTVRLLQSGAWSGPAPRVKFLESPNMVRGVSAAIMSACRARGTPCRVLVVYEDVVAGWPQVSQATVLGLAHAAVSLGVDGLGGVTIPSDESVRAAVKTAFPQQRMATTLYM